MGFDGYEGVLWCGFRVGCGGDGVGCGGDWVVIGWGLPSIFGVLE